MSENKIKKDDCMNDKSEKIKRIIILMIIILMVILIGILIFIGKINKDLTTDVIEYETEITINDELEKEKTRSNYYTVKNIVESYYSNLCSLNKTTEDVLIFEYDEEVEHIEEENIQEIEITKKIIYNFFDENYIKETELTIDNLQEKLGNYKDLYVLIEDMYVRDIAIGLKVYFVFGTITEKDTAKNEDFQLMLILDSKNFTFNIYTADYIKKYNLYELSKEKDLKEKIFNINSIEKREYNKYEYKIVNDEQHAKELLKTYTQSIKYNNINYSYDRLNEEYRTKKFEDLLDYEKYIKENRSNITKSTLKYYKTNVEEGIKQYICVDYSEKYYIFNETSIMDYNLILDTYTVDVQEFVDRYNNLKDDEKVILNIQKLIDATNDGDYKYVYTKLDNTFKITKFGTQEKFEKYIKEKFDPEKDTITYKKYEETAGVHIYEIEITDTSKNKKINAKVVMQLKDDSDFVFSFSAEN